MTRPSFTQALRARSTEGARTSPLSAGIVAPDEHRASSPLSAGVDATRPQALPDITRPAVTKAPAPSTAPKATVPPRPIALPSVEPRPAARVPQPVKQDAAPVAASPAAQSKPEKPKPIKRRNRSRVLTEVDLVILNFLSIVRIAKAEHIADLIKDFKNPDVRTGEIKSPSVRTVTLRMDRLKNFKGKGNGYVDCNREIAGHAIWHLNAKGEHLISTGTRSVIPSNPNWNHYLALAAVAARDIRRGYTLIGDDAINRAVRAHRETAKQEYVPMSVLEANPEYKMPEVGKLVPHYFGIPLGNGKAHRPDLIMLEEGSDPIAVEMELNYKSPESAQANLSGYIRAINEGRIGRVYYYGPDHILRFLNSQLAKVISDPSKVEGKILFIPIDLKARHADIPKIGGF